MGRKREREEKRLKEGTRERGGKSERWWWGGWGESERRWWGEGESEAKSKERKSRKNKGGEKDGLERKLKKMES